MLQIVLLIGNSKRHVVHHKTDYNVKFDIIIDKMYKHIDN